MPQSNSFGAASTLTVGGIQYRYYALEALEKVGKALYWYGPGNGVLDETDATGSTTDAALLEYIYFASQRIGWRDYLNNMFFYVQDQVGSSRQIVKVPNGGEPSGPPPLCYDADFYPYGGEIVFTPFTSCTTEANTYKFQGKERDGETGNDYFGARFYSSTYGRFLSPDWSSIPAPVPYANLTNPQTLNLYAFVNDNPESFADLDGHDPTCAASSNSSSSQPASCSTVTPPQNNQNSSNAASQSNLNTPTQSPDQVQLDTYSAMAQQRAEALNQLSAQSSAPAVGSPDYLSALSGQVNAEMHAGNELILGFALMEGAGVGTVAATAPAAAAIGETVVNAASTMNVAIQNVTLRAVAAVDLAVPGGVIATQQFVQAALSPAKAASTNAGFLGMAANFTYNLVKSIF